MKTKIKDHLANESIQKTDKKTDLGSFGRCKVCNDKASGIHYGLASCESCKSFFKRSVTQKRLQNCVFDNDCPIDVLSRRRCKSCRFNKCLKLGMSNEGVKLGRLTLLEKAKLLNTFDADEIKNDEYEEKKKTESIIVIDDDESLKNLNETTTEKPQNSSATNQTTRPQVFNTRPSEDLFDILIKDFGKEDDVLKDIIQNNAQPDNPFEIVKNAVDCALTKIDYKRSNMLDLYERDEYIRKNFNLDTLFRVNPKLFYESANMLTNSALQELIFSMENENVLYLLTVVRTKVHRLYAQLVRPLERKTEITKEILRKNIKLPQVQKDEAWEAYKSYMKSYSSIVVSFVKELPGFDKVCQHDLTSIIEHSLSIFYPFLNTKLYIDGEFYIILGSFLVDKFLFMEFFGRTIYDSYTEFMNNIQRLNLTNEEISLLIPFILTSPNIPLVYENVVRELNLNYAKALLYEFSLNNRDALFMSNVIQVIGMIVTNNKDFAIINDPFL